MSSFSFTNQAATSNFLFVASGRDGSASVAVKNCLLDIETRGDTIAVVQINPPVYDPVGMEFYCTAICVDLTSIIAGEQAVTIYGATESFLNRKA